MALSNWKIDSAHSSVEFSVRHMMIAKVKGSFHSFDANITADPEDLTTASIEFTVNVSSVDTRNSDRDAHLRSPDFFDADHHPKITFKAVSIQKTGDNEYAVTGDLTIRGVTNPETFKVVYEGGGKDPWGNEKAGFSVEGKINRTKYGLVWNAALETGGVLVGEDVNITLEIEAVKA